MTGDGAAPSPLTLSRLETHSAAPHVASTPTRTSDSVARLVLTPDAVKDQTYFLAHLRPDQLSRTLFPLGALTKHQVREGGGRTMQPGIEGRLEPLVGGLMALASDARKRAQGS